jgi:CBS domain-containing protein
MADLLTAGELCTRTAWVIDRGSTLSAAAHLMRERHVGCLVVVDQKKWGEAVIGILTDRDIVVSAVALDRDAREITVGEVMTRDVVSVPPEAPLSEVLVQMRSHGLRRLPVIASDRVLVGLLSFDDVLAAVALQLQSMVQSVIVERKHEVVEAL